MQWSDIAPAPVANPGAMLALARAAWARDPSPRAGAALAFALYAQGDHAGALVRYEALRDGDPARFAEWQVLAQCYLKSGRPAEALRASEQGIALRGESARLRLRQGRALQALGREAEARVALERCVALGDDGYRGLKALLRPMARAADGAALLDYLDALPPALAGNALVVANRAIAFSRLGRREEARALIDLERDVVQAVIDVPPGYRDLAAFNAALAAEALALRDTPGARDITYRPALTDRPALAALLPLIRGAIEDYLARDLSPALPRPDAGKLFYGATVLRGDGSNGEHIHEQGLISAVYHVQVPDAVAQAEDDRGALTIGDCSHYAAGHRGCWGVLHFKPRAGLLTLFPSHVFHDVVPSRTADPRISVAADLIPIQPGARS